MLLIEGFKEVDSEMLIVQIGKKVETPVWPHHLVKLLGLSRPSYHTPSPDLEHLSRPNYAKLEKARREAGPPRI